MVKKDSISRALFLSVTFAARIVTQDNHSRKCAVGPATPPPPLDPIDSGAPALYPPTFVLTVGSDWSLLSSSLGHRHYVDWSCDLIDSDAPYPPTFAPTVGLHSMVRMVFIVLFARTTDIFSTRSVIVMTKQ